MIADLVSRILVLASEFKTMSQLFFEGSLWRRAYLSSDTKGFLLQGLLRNSSADASFGATSRVAHPALNNLHIMINLQPPQQSPDFEFLTPES
jgi:hypothetical protein